MFQCEGFLIMINLKYAFVFFVYLFFSFSSTSSIPLQVVPLSDELKNLLIKEQIPQIQFEVIRIFPHDKSHFTEGLKFSDDELFESIGLYGSSELKKINIENGETLKQVKLPNNMFAEGITIINDKIYQLTYLEQKGLIYDKATFTVLRYFNYSGQGWGLTNDGTHLIMSNGSSEISFLDMISFKVSKKIDVHVNSKKIYNVNELEYVKNKIFANIWLKDIIIVLSPETGEIVGFLDVAKLRPMNCRADTCPANGIAYQKNKDLILLTGKYWPHMYQIRLKNEIA